MKWTRPKINEGTITLISNTLKIDKLYARILVNRNIDINKARLLIYNYNEAIINPKLLTNAVKASDVITEYCKDENAKIYVFGDYDCDGTTAGYTMTDGLRKISKCPIELYLPEREEGYGLNMKWAKSIIKKHNKDKVLVITVDNGITQIEEIKLLKDNNIEVIVTDHHVAKKEVPNCIIVNPHNHNEPDTFKHLAGCGVAFKVVQLVQHNFGVYDMEKYTPAIAIGTLADMMPMHEENIAFIKYGLNIINSEKCPIGIKEFMNYMGKTSLTAKEIAWELAPRINSCGRLNNVNLGSQLFFEEDKDNIKDIYKEIEKTNTKRKSYSDKAKKMIKEHDFSCDEVCVVNLEGYPQGVIGIIAGEIQKQTGKASVVTTEVDGKLIGSARGVNYLNLQEVFEEQFNKDTMLEYGGHEMAAGVSIDKNKLNEFKSSINESVLAIKDSIDMTLYETEDNELIIDEQLNLEQLNEETFNIINLLPYDKGNFTQPIFALIGLEVIKIKTSNNNPNNICFTVKDNTKKMDIWAWGYTEKYKEMGSPKYIHIAGYLERNFMNPKTFTLQVQDILGES